MRFYEVLFDPGEMICKSKDLFETAVSPVHLQDYSKLFFVINPLKEKRSDANVTSLRNILLEFDSGTISEQQKMLQESGLPYSTLVFSGGKSLHAIISLTEPIATQMYYRSVAKAIYKKFPLADPKVFNPSRFSRAPGAMRDNGIEQALLEVKERVPLTALLAWIGPIALQNYAPEHVSEMLGSRALPVRVSAFLKYGAPEGLRNSTLFINACEMFRAGYNEEEIVNLVLSSPLELSLKEVRSCIRSAKNRIL